MADPVTENLIAEAESLPDDAAELVELESQIFDQGYSTFDVPAYDQDGNPTWSEQ